MTYMLLLNCALKLVEEIILSIYLFFYKILAVGPLSGQKDYSILFLSSNQHLSSLAMPLLSRLVVVLSQRRVGFSPRPVHVIFVAGKVLF